MSALILSCSVAEVISIDRLKVTSGADTSVSSSSMGFPSESRSGVANSNKGCTRCANPFDLNTASQTIESVANQLMRNSAWELFMQGFIATSHMFSKSRIYVLPRGICEIEVAATTPR